MPVDSPGHHSCLSTFCLLLFDQHFQLYSARPNNSFDYVVCVLPSLYGILIYLSMFPPEIYATTERPGIMIWSVSVKKIFLIELTCPAEEGIQAARERKLGRYQGLADSINASHWSATVIPFEVGARGFVAHSTHSLLAQLGIRGRDKSAVCRKLGMIAARASFAIYLAHSNPVWDQN